MIVVLEGPDGSGKTVLAGWLQGKHGWEYVHTGAPRPGENVLLSYAQTLYDAHLSGKHTVIDRLHLGERIYGPIVRNQDLLGEEGLTILNRILTAYKAKVIICIPPFENVRNTWERRTGKEYVKNADHLEQIYLEYGRLAGSNGIAAWDFTMTSYVEVSRYITNSAHLVTRDIVLDHVIGSLTPKFLFVSEKANQEKLDLPWVSLEGSSHYLYTAMKAAGFQENEVAFVNVLKLDGKKNNITEIWRALDKPIVVTFGNIATLEAQRFLGKTIYSQPHPAYWKRFHSSMVTEYVSSLKAIRDDALGLHPVS